MMNNFVEELKRLTVFKGLLMQGVVYRNMYKTGYITLIT